MQQSISDSVLAVRATKPVEHDMRGEQSTILLSTQECGLEIIAPLSSSVKLQSHAHYFLSSENNCCQNYSGIASLQARRADYA